MRLIILIIICTIVAIIIGVILLGQHYMNSYLRVNGVGLWSTREDVINRFGEPIHTTASDDGFFGSFHYDGIQFSLGGFYHTPPSKVIAILITNPDIRFGRNSIGVGSTRQEIEQIEWNRWPLRYSRNSFDHAFMVSRGHDAESIWFWFDNNDIVYRISIGFNSS